MFDFSKKLVLFDRDGVLNENALVRRPEELRLLSNALRGIARLTRAGFRVGVCTNQGAIARGALDEAMLAQIHARLLLVVREFGGDIARIVFCASADAAHPWRKPNPGMLLDQAAHFGVALTGVPLSRRRLGRCGGAGRRRGRAGVGENGQRARGGAQMARQAG